MYVSSKRAQDFYKVSGETLRTWSHSGKIETIITNGGHHRYKLIPKYDKKTKLKNYIYARVSSKKQENDLKRQINYISEKYPTYEIISDIGSGLNFKRKGLKTLLEQIMCKRVNEVVVSDRDRLSRFGFELFKFICSKNSTKLTVLSDDKSKTNIEELTDDLMAIITVFTARYYGKRRYKLL
jgi:predicted site-specific integrase-resolvase